MNKILTRLRMYWSLTKSLQTGLLLVTGLAGYFSARCPWHSNELVALLGVTMFLAIAGSTVLNMVWDRDIDAKMVRTCWRPLPAGRINVTEAAALGITMSVLGIGGAWLVQPLYSAFIFAGWFFDVVVYTMWLKRRTPWSILWGGIAGAMPILAGRALGTGTIDAIGMLLALAILFWIPTHILTFGIKYAEQYRAAGVPILPNTYGEWITRMLLGLSTALAVVAMLLAAWHIRIPWNYFHIALWLGGALLGAALLSVVRQSPRLNFVLYKFASLYMLGAMILIMLGVLES
jgi:protoheme IX farnesyltransferase